jgi:hypothetical protein
MLKAESLATNLPALPAQPADVPWPTKGWPRTSLPPNPRFETLVDEIFNLTGVQGDTHAFLVVAVRWYSSGTTRVQVSPTCSIPGQWQRASRRRSQGFL